MVHLIHSEKDIQVTTADIEDWHDILALREYVVNSKATDYITTDPAELKAFLHHSYTMPERVGFLLMWWKGHLIGMVGLLLTDQPVVTSPGIAFSRQVFINSVYIAPWIWKNGDRVEKERVPVYAGKEFLEAMSKWGRAPRSVDGKGATYIYGNVRLNGNFAAFFEKYGFERQSVVIGRPL